MKRLLSWMLVLCMAFSLIPAGIAEELFAEESFFDAGASIDEEIFAEEGFFSDDSLFAPAEEELDVESRAFFNAEDEGEEEDLDEDAVIESRSIVSLITDWEPKIPAKTDADWEQNKWKMPPVLKAEDTDLEGKKSDVIVLSWTVSGTEMTKYDSKIKFYLYEIDNKTGVAYQVGKPIKPKYDKKNSCFSNKVTLKKLEGSFTYFVRAEQLTPGTKNKKLAKEVYGVSSNKVTVNAVLSSWKKKVAKIVAVQQGNQAVVSFVDVNNVNGFEVKVNGSDTYTFWEIADGVFALNGEPTEQPGKPTLLAAGTAFTFRLDLPASPAESYKFTITPLKRIDEYGSDGKIKNPNKQLSGGVSATSKALKILTTADNKWKTLSDFSVKEVEDYAQEASTQPTVAGAVKMSWAYSAAEGVAKPTNYVITGLLGGVTLNISADDKVEVVDKKNAVISATAAPKDENNLVKITVIAKTKVAASAKISVQPKQGKVKGVKTTATVALRGLAQPKILSGAQTDDAKVTIRFTQGSVPEKDELFILTGFKKKMTLIFDGTKFDDANAKLIWNEDTQQDDIIEFTGDVKVGTKVAVKKFTVKAMLGKKTSKASAKFSVTVRPSGLAAALNVKFGTVKTIKTEEGSEQPAMDVTFDVLNTAEVDDIYVSVVSGDSFSAQPDATQIYQVKKTYKNNEVKVENGKGTATFTGIKAGETYSALVEVILQEGRIVDSVTSVAAGEKAKDPRLVINADKVDAFQKALNNGDGHYYDEESRKVWIADAENKIALPVGALYEKPEMAEGLGWDVLVDGKVQSLKDAKLEVGENGLVSNNFRIRPTFAGVCGDWIEAKIEVYRALKVKFMLDENGMGKASFIVEVEGGSNPNEAKVELKDADGKEYADPANVELPGEKGTKTSFTLTVKDAHLKTSDGTAVTVTGGPIEVEKSDRIEKGPYTYEKIKKDDATDKTLAVVKYTPAKDEEANQKTPTVPDKITFGGEEYTILQITGMGEETEYVGAFEGLDITDVTLPNAIEVIGVKAFSGCTNLASMTCY